MKVLDSTTRAYRLNGNAISEASLDVVLSAAYAILAKNDEIAPPFEKWDEEEISVGDDTLLCYFTTTDSGKQIRLCFSVKDMTAKIMLLSGEEEYFIDDNLFCTIRSENKYLLEEWL
ncbi:hypothetical protein CUJ83_11800 [Methanocella sp. CWC-04]|uniref:Uncharacterized protein n=1 Tax=Methanooceanicella nereidis TaxID=2052831 RepID=A0AAP2RDM4_9EURY|nr:hypothetical protein [Methanocella sp. CWC-04]MCD1295681.1 hypothetical protein [Methanocella sp. CWC-04]